MTKHQSISDPFAALVPDDAGDYELTLFFSVDRQDNRRGADGRWAPDRLLAFRGEFCVEAGRKDGAWRLRVSPYSGDYCDDTPGPHVSGTIGPPLVDLRDRIDRPNPLRMLLVLLTGEHA